MFPILPPSPPFHHIPNKMPVFVGEVQRTQWLSFSSRTIMFCWTCLARNQLVMVLSPLMDFDKFQFISVTQLCPTLCDPMNRSMPGFPVHHQLPESTQTHVHWVSDAIQPSHPLLSPSPPAFNLSQHQGLLKWISSPHQVAKVLEFQLQHQSLQWTPGTDLL